jgi:hypothetical protein
MTYKFSQRYIHAPYTYAIPKLFFRQGQASDRWLAEWKTVSVGVDTPLRGVVGRLRASVLVPRLNYGPPMYKRHRRVVLNFTKLKLSALSWYSSEGQDHTDVPLCGLMFRTEANHVCTSSAAQKLLENSYGET